jgi:superfamily I DNA/RNA helicase
VLWKIFEKVLARISQRSLLTEDQIFSRLAQESTDGHSVFDVVVLDEAQDVSVAQLKYLAALAGKWPNGLFFAGDTGQRIFELPFSWKAVGVDIVGRSKTLRVNYRTSHQIRSQADKLLEPEISDVDGNREKRNSTISVFEGDTPSVSILDDENAEIQHVARWIQKIIASGVSANEVCVIVRSEDEVNRAKQACMASGTDFQILDEKMEASTGKASICTMHLAKGLEYRAVAVMACDDCIIPLESRMKASGDDADLEITYETERHLLYVACTRARDYLLVTAVKPGSEFLEDLMD